MRILFFTLLTFLSTTVVAQNERSFKKLDNYFAELEKHNRFMGNTLIMKDDKIVYHKEIGYSDKANNIRHTPNSIFRVGSITKTYTATIILKLVEEGKIKLDDKLVKYFSKIENADKITIQQMLNHNSGLANYTDQRDFGKYLNKAHSHSKMLKRIAKLKSDFEPGSKHEYSNTNFMLLGYIAEQVADKTYNQLLQQYIVSPLKLKNTYYQLGNGKLKDESKSYVRHDGWDKIPSWNLDVAGAAGALRATTKDLAIFAHNLFQGNILSEASLRAMTTFEDGYGLGLLTAPFHDRTLLTHGGKIEGFKSIFFHNKEADVTFVILCNGNNFVQNNISIAMASAYFGKDFSIPNMAEKEEIEVAVGTLRQYEGVFVSESFPLDIKVFIKKDKLFAQATGQGVFPLKAVGENEFEFKSAGIQITFVKTGDDFSEMKFSQGGTKVLFKKK